MKTFFNSLFSPAGLILLVLLAGRISFIQLIGLNLSPDEAYYWDWSRHLAWGYYSKPPMIAWIIHVFTHVLGVSEYGIRVPAALFHTAYLAFVFYLGKLLFDEKVGFWAMVAAAASPLAAVYSFVMTIDPPLFAFWALALCLAWQAAESQKFKDFFFLGIVIGLGLLTKQTMIAFLVFFFVWLALSREKRSLLKSPKSYLVALIVFLMILPNLLWNAKHGWITFKHTSHHFEEEWLNFLGPLIFLGEQAGVITPIIFGLMLFVFALFLSKEKLRNNEKLLFLFVFSALPLALVLPLSLLRKVNANWPYPFYAAGFVMLSALVLRGSWGESQKRLVRGLFFAGIILGMLVMMATYQLARTPEIFPPKLQRLLYKFTDWRDFASWVQKERKNQELVITLRRDFASELAFYLPDRPHTYTFWQGYVKSQYDLWDGLHKRLGEDAILVLSSRSEAKRYASCFEKLVFLGQYKKNIFGKKRQSVIFKGYNLKMCPYLDKR
ncbi:glycosyl transferase family 39 [Thermodesulfatator indicus DSM 15286]|uniref:Glycosyl transferase family 39 n=1 Tax=Thermodesulfatator indicus (strain DSM 15286 / JCM 11887 / CIR29812) TaxID=667014 RepID=F8ABD9_THEID|nr:glycosyltransferase family 39 protein [Thermodesulfatator indicus]AEH44449.1 glycosyl transferase family 39 [Thermodesulfatator indicus DSM 15286]